MFAEEDYFPKVSARNIWDNMIIGSQPSQDFSLGGVGWTGTPASNHQIQIESKKDIADISTWTKEDTEIAQGVISPDGANDAYTITRKNTGNSSVQLVVKELDSEYGNYTFSVWARGVDEFLMRLAFRNFSNKWIYLNKPIKLNKRWQQYWITVPSQAIGDNMTVCIFIGTESDGKSTGQIEVWKPEITYGEQPAKMI